MTEIRRQLSGELIPDRRFRRRVGAGIVLAVSPLVLASLAPAPDLADPVPPESAAAITGPAAESHEDLPTPRVARPLGEGSASYYSDLLEGRPTASGQPYRGSELTAAHRTLPFGSRVRVTNLANGNSVVVRVNDRGPFARRHVVDVSRAAAGRLGILAEGHAQVSLELVP